MKKYICYVVLIVFLIMSVSCGSSKTIPFKETRDGREQTMVYTFQQYGLFDMDKRNSKVQYKVVVGNVVWSVILFSTVFVPVILIGWYLYEPVDVAVEGVPGAVKQ